ncbi:MAG: MFS transporter [Candidatus Omnitrophota bacterium]
MPRFRKLLKNRDFVLYSIGQAFSQFGDRLVQIVLIGFIYKRWPGSTFQLAKLLFFTVIPSFLISPIAGVYVDRWNRKRILVFSDLVRAALIILIPIFFINKESIIPIYLVVFLIFASACFFLPARLSVIPNLVSKEDLLLANSASSITWVISGIIGFSFGGLLAEWIGVQNSLYINSLVYLLSAASFTVLIYSMQKRDAYAETERNSGSDSPKKTIARSFLNDLIKGIKTLFSDKKLKFVAYIFFILSAMTGAFYVVAVVFIQEILHSMTKSIGIFGMCLFVGIMLGSYVYGKTGHRYARTKAIYLSLIMAGFFINAFTVVLQGTRSLWPGSFLVILLGLFIAPLYVSANTIIYEFTESELRGRIFSSIGVVMNLGFLIFMFISSMLAENIDRFWILISCGSGFVLLGILGMLTGFLKKTTFSS